MVYKKFQELKLSALGLGCMRLPTKGADAEIDEAAVKQMVAYAMEKGINYYDTAWGYHSGQSELVMGRVLSEYPRDRFYLASKFPGYDVSNLEKVEEIFERQLEKCRVEYFDFYLYHNVCEANIEFYLDPKYGLHDYLLEQKRRGRIRHLGFSVHGSYGTAKRFLEAYGKDMEFGQVQLNYLDYGFQAADKKLELLREYGIPVWVMEPLRGGKLANLEEGYAARLAALRPEETPVSWAFRYLQSIPEVGVILSGMSNFEQLKQNIAIFEEEKPLNEAEIKVTYEIAGEMLAAMAIPCTDCRYCKEKCPMQLDIPYLIGLYNEHAFTGGGFIAPMALSALPDDKLPSACIGCKSCEAVCPQQIKISSTMRAFTRLID